MAFICAAVRLGPDGLLPDAAPQPATAAPAIDDPQQASPELQRILTAMTEDAAFRDMGLTIGGLADSLGIPEHRLRRIINGELGYRNFNDFLNHYRLAAVTQGLSDPELAQVPILTIAMEAGYRSMTTFNRSFRATFDQTPSAWRQQQLTNSEKS